MTPSLLQKHSKLMCSVTNKGWLQKLIPSYQAYWYMCLAQNTCTGTGTPLTSLHSSSYSELLPIIDVADISVYVVAVLLLRYKTLEQGHCITKTTGGFLLYKGGVLSNVVIVYIYMYNQCLHLVMFSLVFVMCTSGTGSKVKY